MSAFDGEVFRIRALVRDRYGNHSVVERWADDERHMRSVAAGLKGRKGFGGERTVSLRVDRLHYVVAPREDMSFGEATP